MLDVIGKMYALYAVFRPNPGHAIFACNARNTNLFLGIVGIAESAKTGTNPYCWPTRQGPDPNRPTRQAINDDS